MEITRPSQVYPGTTKEHIERWLKINGLRVIAFRQPAWKEYYLIFGSGDTKVEIFSTVGYLYLAKATSYIPPGKRLILEYFDDTL
jgi:hypothetical protein